MDGIHRTCLSFLHHFSDMGLKLSAPVVDNIKLADFMHFNLPTILFTIILFMFIVDMIVIYSMMITDVEERTYEFAMLRTLGFQNSSLVVLLFVQALFISLPATLIGFVLLNIFTSLAQVILYTHVNISLVVPVHQTTIMLGLLTGVGVPFFSNIYPMKQAMGYKLRDSLDRSRQSVDEVEV